MSCSAEHRHWMLRFKALGALLLWASSCSLSESPGSVLENADINSDSESNGVDTENTPNVPDSSPVQDVVNETLAEDTLIQEDAPESGDAEMPGPWIRLLEPKPLILPHFTSRDFLVTTTGQHLLRVRAEVSPDIFQIWIHIQGPAVKGDALVLSIDVPVGSHGTVDLEVPVEQGMGYISAGTSQTPPPLDWYSWSDWEDISVPVTRPFYVVRIDCVTDGDCDDEVDLTSDHCRPGLVRVCEHSLLQSDRAGCYDYEAAKSRKQDAFAEYATLIGGCTWSSLPGAHTESAVYTHMQSGCIELVACMWSFFGSPHIHLQRGPVVVRCNKCGSEFSSSPCCDPFSPKN